MAVDQNVVTNDSYYVADYPEQPYEPRREKKGFKKQKF